MPAAALMADIGLSIPLTAAQRPFILWVGGTDLIGYVDKTSYSLDDRDLTQPGIFTFVVIDPLNTVGPNIHRLDEVMWFETLTTGGMGRILFRGFIRQIDVNIVANYGLWTLTCADLSEMLDYGEPVVVDSRPAETTLARVQYVLGNYGTASSMGTGGFISALSGATQPATDLQRETVRTSVEKSLALEATAANQPNYYLDYLYQLHVFYGLGDVAAPYNLTDGVADHLTTVNYSGLAVTYDSTADADGVYVYGATPAGSGIVMSGIPRWPAHIGYIDASASASSVTTVASGLAELGRRQGVIRATVVVEGYDGWTKGQYLTLTNVVLGLSAVTFWLAGVSMTVMSGTGYRSYTLQLNASLPRLSRIVAAATTSSPLVGSAVQGQIGSQ